MYIVTEMMNIYLVLNCLCEEYQKANIWFPIINQGLTMVAILDVNSTKKYIIKFSSIGQVISMRSNNTSKWFKEQIIEGKGWLHQN
jgi:hypothetical protein